MSVDVQAEVLIRRSRAAVAGYMFDPANDAAWTTGVIACNPLTEGRLAVGSRVERHVKFLGRQFSYVYEVIDAGGDHFVEMTVDQPFPMHVRYELEDAPEGTLARIRTHGDATGFFSIAAPLMAPMVRRSIAKDLAQLRAILQQP